VKKTASEDSAAESLDTLTASLSETKKQIPMPSEYDFKKYQPSSLNGFKRIPNPELTLYVYPHFAGQSQVPAPGYFTGFAYKEDYWSLNN
jgi:conjugative transfer region lipoprotein (TIGR03751 family)